MLLLIINVFQEQWLLNVKKQSLMTKKKSHKWINDKYQEQWFKNAKIKHENNY